MSSIQRAQHLIRQLSSNELSTISGDVFLVFFSSQKEIAAPLLWRDLGSGPCYNRSSPATLEWQRIWPTHIHYSRYSTVCEWRIMQLKTWWQRCIRTSRCQGQILNHPLPQTLRLQTPGRKLWNKKRRMKSPCCTMFKDQKHVHRSEGGRYWRDLMNSFHVYVWFMKDVMIPTCQKVIFRKAPVSDAPASPVNVTFMGARLASCSAGAAAASAHRCRDSSLVLTGCLSLSVKL